MKEKPWFEARSSKSFSSFYANFSRLLPLQEKQSKPLELILVAMEYIQLISQILITTVSTFTASTSDFFINATIKIIDIVNIGYYIGLEKTTFSKVILVLMLCYVLTIYLAITWLVATFIRRKRQSPLLASFLWQSLRLHGRAVFYLILMFCVGWLKRDFTDDAEEDQSNSVSFSILSILLLAISSILPASVWTFCEYKLPSKSALAATNYRTELITLTQKIIQGILFITLADQAKSTMWILCILNLVFDFLRGNEFFMTLPNYDLQVLFWRGALITATFTLNVCVFAFNVKSSVSDEIDFGSFILISMIMIFFTFILYRAYYQRKIAYILFHPFKSISAHNLIHKIQYLKEATSKRFKKKESEFWKLVLVTLDKRKSEIFRIPEEIDPEGVTIFENSTALKSVILQTLQEGLVKYPKSDMLRLYCAYYFGKKIKLYGPAMKLLEMLEEKSSNTMTKINAGLLKSELQRAINMKQKEETDSLNIIEFISMTRKLKDLKQKMTEQASLQYEIYKEWENQAFDIGKIQHHSIKIESLRTEIESQEKHLLNEKPDFYLEPLVLLAYYSLQVNFSPSEYSKFIRLYTQKMHNFQAKLKTNDLTPESLFDANNIELILSTKTESSGIVVSCTQNTDKILGRKPAFIIGKSFASLGPPSLNRFYQDLIADSVISDHEGSLYQDGTRLFITHEQGHIIPVNCHISLYPFLDSGVYLHVVIRPTTATRDYVLVTREGYIESYTRDIGKELNLLVSKSMRVHVGKLNGQLNSVNAAMDFMLSNKKTRLSQLINPQDVKEESDVKLSAKTSSDSIVKSKVLEAESPTIPETPNDIPVRRPLTRKGSVINNDISISFARHLMSKKSQKLLLTGKNAEQIYNEYQGEGKCLNLLPLSNNGESVTFTTQFSLGNVVGKSVEYNCNIENKSYGDSIVKVFILEQMKSKNSENDLEKYLEKDQPKSRFLEIDMTKVAPVVKRTTSTPMKAEEVDLSCNFDTENEKNEGERPSIYESTMRRKDFPSRTLDSPPISPLMSPSMSPLMMSFVLESASPRKDQSPTASLLIDRSLSSPKNLNNQLIPAKRTSKMKKALNVFKVVEQIRRGEHDNGMEPLHSSGTTTSKSQDERLYKTLKHSLDLEYYSKSTTTFILTCYTVILVFIGTQIFTSIDARNRFSQLDWQKEVLVNAETRADLMVRITRRFRCLALIPEDLLPETLFNQIVPNARNVFYNLAAQEILELVTANADLLIDSAYLDESERKTLFINNVRVYNSLDSEDDYEMLNTFQATSRVLDLGFQALTASNVSLALALPIYNLIFKDSLNDILIQSEDNVVTVYSLLDNAHQTLLLQTKVILAVLVLLFVMLLVGAGVLLVKLYKREVDVLSGLLKTDKNLIQELANGIVKFKVNLNEEIYYEEANLRAMSNYHKHISNLGIMVQQRVKQDQGLKNTLTIKKYLQNVAKITAFFLYIVLFITLDRLLLFNVTSKLYSQVDRMRFMKELQLQTTLESASYVEIMFANLTTTIMNKPSKDFYESQMTVITEDRLETTTVLQNDDGSMDVFLEEALSGNACGLLTGSIATTCTTNAAGAEEAGLLKFMTKLQSLVINAMNDFFVLNRTKENITTALYNIVGLTVPVNNIITGIINTIYAYLEDKFEQEVKDYSDLNQTVNAVGMCILVLLSGILWNILLKGLRDCDNNLKKTLKNFPLNLMLKNYKLRSYILKTSGSKLKLP